MRLSALSAHVLPVARGVGGGFRRFRHVPPLCVKRGNNPPSLSLFLYTPTRSERAVSAKRIAARHTDQRPLVGGQPSTPKLPEAEDRRRRLEWTCSACGQRAIVGGICASCGASKGIDGAANGVFTRCYSFVFAHLRIGSVTIRCATGPRGGLSIFTARAYSPRRTLAAGLRALGANSSARDAPARRTRAAIGILETSPRNGAGRRDARPRFEVSLLRPRRARSSTIQDSTRAGLRNRADGRSDAGRRGRPSRPETTFAWEASLSATHRPKGITRP
jgi:hypothetical protein